MTIQNKLPDQWIFIRGLTRSRFHWQDFPEYFKNNLKIKNVICPEIAGNGYYFDKQSPTQMNLVIQQIEKQIPDFENHTYGLLAISMGGMIASYWANQQPVRFNNLILINSSFSDLSSFSERLNPIHYLNILSLALNASKESIEKFILDATINTNYSEEILKNYIEFQTKHPIKLANFLRQLFLASKANSSLTPKIPSLILTSKSDRLVNYLCSVKIAQKWNAKLAIHETAGHDLPFDDAPWICDQIKKNLI